MLKPQTTRMNTLAVLLTVLVGLTSFGCTAQSSSNKASNVTSAPTLAQIIASRPYQEFGNPMTGEMTDFVTADTVLAYQDDYLDKPVRIYGIVKEVCPKRGCWIRVAGHASNETFFVKFTCPIEGRLIPLEALNKSVVVEGVFQKAQISEATARHYAEDAGATPEEVAAITGPQSILRMASATARVFGLPSTNQPVAEQTATK